MGIRDKRFFRAVNRILREELQKGNLPSSKEFAYRLNQYLYEQDLSKPEFNFKPVRGLSTARAYEYNQSMNLTNNDLSTLYENTIDIHNLLSNHFSKFEVNKSKLEYEINTLENRMKELILLYSNNGFLNTVYDVFDDITKVNAKESSAHVDIKLHEAIIPEIKNTSTKIIPDAQVRFDILPEIANDVQVIPISGAPSDALSDSINAIWQQQVLTNIRQNVAGYFFIDFNEKQTLNRVDISLMTVKPTLVRIEFSPDSGINWFTVPYFEQGKLVADAYKFEFPTLEATSLRILLSKSEPDDQSVSESYTQDVDANMYKYTIGVKHIGLYNMDYPTSARLVSNPLKVDVPAGQNFSISEVSLNVEEVLPAATDIKYYIAMPPESGDPEWKSISPVNRENPAYDQIIDFRNITNAPPSVMMIDPNISISEYKMDSLYANGINFYKIGEVDGKAIVGSTERLFAGKNSWGVKKFSYQWSDHGTHVPSMSDWAQLQSYEYDFVKIEDGKEGVLLNGVTHTQAYNYMFTAGVLSAKEQDIQAVVPSSTEPIAIYVNGTMVFQGIPDQSSKVPFTFNYGWNEVVILLYVRNISAANGASLDANINLKRYGTNVYSQSNPMELVSLHDLQYNVKSNDRTKYALYNVNDKTYVILNHAVSGMEYDFYYNYVEGDAKDTILFKAEFIKSDQHSSISPKLKSYRLRFS